MEAHAEEHGCDRRHHTAVFQKPIGADDDTDPGDDEDDEGDYHPQVPINLPT